MMRFAPLAALAALSASPVLAQEAAGPPPTPAVAARAAALPAGHYALDHKHSFVNAVARHLGVSDYVMRFDRFDADFTYDPAHPEATRLQASVDTTSLDVGADYSRSFADQFLGAAKYPRATFVATAITANADGHTGTMTGDLNLDGVTRPVTFAVTFVGAGHGFPFGFVAGFRADAVIKRSEFGSHAWAKVVGDEVELIVRGQFDKK